MANEHISQDLGNHTEIQGGEKPMHSMIMFIQHLE